MTTEKDRYSSNALIRGLEILKMFSAEEPTLSLNEIASKLGVNRTVPFRLLSTLQSFGYVHKDEQTKRYQLAPKVLELGFSYLHSLQLPEIAQPYLEQLRDDTGASVYLSILDGAEVVYVGHARIVGFKGIFVNTGMRFPAHATANGKLLLAFQPPDKLRSILRGAELKPYTQQTKTLIADLEAELRLIRERGYAMTNSEFQQGISSIAAPIFNQSGAVMAAVNVVAAETFFDDAFIREKALPRLLDTTGKLSGFMGFGHQ
ncbi:hypothetical protein SD70_22240 [Gordoniibacillus kamchatkensis]|uniref:IclR family transcriptional regulator n=1 Tax=Gordoniibacillus kamchatkensis TaxID=1590651 RepID=A0ABR5ADY8_9BACL|nr:IclR family transcriptional regulator [Paenibacillus sp. VKM B-2647]KIL39097.1 hypothetical protein SD70_22240 [Paenibacillus sp. VKM B-2647]